MNVRFFSVLSLLVLLSVGYVFIFSKPSTSLVTNNEKGGPYRDGALSISMTNASTKSILGYESVYGALPRSLQGTGMQQALIQDDQGNLILTPDLRRVFEYFLSANQEESLEIITKRIKEYLAFHLDDQGLTQANEILNDFIQMKTALLDFEKAQGQAQRERLETGEKAYGIKHLEHLESMLQQRKALRDQLLGSEVANMLYGAEDTYDAFMLEKLKIERNDKLELEEKAMAMEALYAQQDQDWVASRKRAALPEILRDGIEKRRQEGASDDEIYDYRVKMVGVEAANRHTQLDQERAQWQQRITEYLSARQRILDQPGLDEADQHAQIDQLKSSQFNRREQIRLQVYERQASR